MNWYDTLFEVIDMRSFSNLWYWIALAVTWSSASHWVLGVPWDMIQRARRQGGQMATDVEAMVRINVSRLLLIDEVSGLWVLGLVCAGLTTLGLLGFAYGVEFAQATFLLLFPLTIVGALSVWTARRLAAGAGDDGRLYAVLRRHRVAVQVIGMASIFVTSMFGMYQNLQLGAWS